MIVAGSVAIAPAVLAGNGSGNNALNLTEPYAIYGYLTDGTGTPIDGVTVTVTNAYTGVSFTSVTGSEGTPGSYEVDVADISGEGCNDGDLIHISTPEPNQAYNSTTVDSVTHSFGEMVNLTVDTVDPVIGATTVDKMYINNQGTFGGTPSPVNVTVDSVTDDVALGAAAWAVRDENLWNGTMYFSCDITNEAMPATYAWDGSQYFIDGELVTATITPFYSGSDILIFGEVNGSHVAEDVIGNTYPEYYALFDSSGTYQTVYATRGTLNMTDDIEHTPVVGDTFRAYRYDEGDGYMATAALSTFSINPWVALTISAAPDGRYAVCVSAMDKAGNTNWTNETTGNPVITVDNYPAYANATGPDYYAGYAFEVTYDFTADPTPSSGLLNVSLWHNLDGAGWVWFAEDPTPSDGLFPVDLSGLGDGTYEWFMAAFDMTLNHEDLLFTAEATTLVDTGDPVIGATTVDKLYINNQGTFGGTPPPVTVTVDNVTDTNLLAAAWGIRAENQWEGTLYFTYDITNDVMPSIRSWNGSWYHISGELVTVTMTEDHGMDLIVYGELDGANATGHEIGNNMPSHYAVFSSIDLSVTMYETHGSLDVLDHDSVTLTGGEVFQPYRYDEGTGYIVSAASSTYTVGDNFWIPLDLQPIPDGRYAVCVSAMDEAGNTAWTNETTPNPVITVDNYPAYANATGPAVSTVYAFNITYDFVADPAPSSGLLNVSLWHNLDGAGWVWFAEDLIPGDGQFPVDVTALGDGTYEWYMTAYDKTNNHELLLVAEAATIVDTAAPNIDIASATPMYVNTAGTFGGNPPPVTIWTNVTDDNLLTAAIGIRNEDTGTANQTYYVTYNFTANPISWDWDGNMSFVNSELVTASYSENYGADTIVWGEFNGGNNTGDILGKGFIPSHYALFGAGITIYETHGTLTASDDTIVTPVAPDTFKVYRYDGNDGYIVGGEYADPINTMTLNTLNAPDGRYAVVVSAIDAVGNTNWRNEVGGNPVITVDNTQPTLTTEMILSTDNNANTYIDTSDIITIWVNVTDLNEDATTIPTIDVDETDFPDSTVSGLGYMGGGVWICNYTVLAGDFNTSNIDVSFRDLANNLVDAPDALFFDIYGTFGLGLSAGWNLISIPVLNPIVDGLPFTNAYNFTQQGASMVSAWDQANQVYVNFIAGFHLPGEPQDFALEEDLAYWVWMPGADLVAISGELPHQRNVIVGTGWNLVGYMHPTVIGDVETDWADDVQAGSYDDIAYYNGTTFIHYITGGDSMDLVPGRGYFVWSDESATIIYGS